MEVVVFELILITMMKGGMIVRVGIWWKNKSDEFGWTECLCHDELDRMKHNFSIRLKLAGQVMF